jgi:hypothetical protein
MSRPGDALRHPLVLVMLTLWILNDHVFKAMFGNVLTGKLSDIAGLVVFPLMLVAAYEIGCALRGLRAVHTAAVLWASLGASAALMISINLFDVCADACRLGLGLAQWPFVGLGSIVMGGNLPPLAQVNLTMDPTDLWALPALLIPYMVTRHQHWSENNLERSSSIPAASSR